MATGRRSLATALWRARFTSGLLRQSYTTRCDTTATRLNFHLLLIWHAALLCDYLLAVITAVTAPRQA